ncbi:MAG: prolyl oligopeptidase family serine peptidase [Caulobacteraceae bacterium]
MIDTSIRTVSIAVLASVLSLATGLAPASAAPRPAATGGDFTLEQVLGYPFVSGLAAADHADRIAWVVNVRGVRNVWIADGAALAPRQLTHYKDDDGQELTQLTFSPDGGELVYVRGGDHDANWQADGHLDPDPTADPEQQKTTIWSIAVTGGAPVKVAEGDGPALNDQGRLAYVKDDQVWTASIDGTGKPERLFFDRGKDAKLVWSPDGARLAFESRRGDHGFIGVFTAKDRPLVYLAPSTGRDSAAVWSPDGSRIAFTRAPGMGGPPEPMLTQQPRPWSIWTARADGGDGHQVWKSPDTIAGSYPDIAGRANLRWAADDRLVFMADLDDWPHLYSIPAAGGAPLLLTPGPFMVEDVVESRDRRFLVYSANTGATAGDDDRRHVFRVPVDRATPVALTNGEGVETLPAIATPDRVAFIAAGPKSPATVAEVDVSGHGRREVASSIPADFPSQALLIPKLVSFKAADGQVVQGQLFQRDDGGPAKPGVIFVHGGPKRQMLLGWHYMDYYANSYAVNQYLANHGFTVLSINYRLGIGYGQTFEHPEHAGAAGAAEYQDVQAGARFLQQVHGVNPGEIGIWGGSYGGYLTGLALSRNSDVFKAGVDMHGVHDWSALLVKERGLPEGRYEKGDWDEAMKVAFQSSPAADAATWRSPVLLIQGDDDRNVLFHQMVDMARRLDANHTPYEEMVIPNEIHGFLRHESWLKADEATVEFLGKELKGTN